MTRLWFAAYLCDRAKWRTCTYLGPDKPTTCPEHGTEPMAAPELVEHTPDALHGWVHNQDNRGDRA